MLNWLTEAGLQTLQNGYLIEDETPEDAYMRVAVAASSRLKRPDLTALFYEAMTKNWLCPATPVLSNMGTTRGLPISCFGLQVPDSVDGIFRSAHELAMMSKGGGGVGIGLNGIRPRGAPITGNGRSEGIVPWAKVYDSAVISVSQGSTRRGSASVNLSVDHGDIDEFLRIRRPSGDVNRQCLNLNHCVQVSDAFMEKVAGGDERSRAIWLEILKARMETGEPYVMFTDTVNRASPAGYGKVSMTNICSEITLYTDDEHSFVCCLSSLNLSRWDEWNEYRFSNGMSLPQLGVYFLDGVLTEFIDRSANVPGMERSRASAIAGRALGLGVLGWHTYLQQHEMAFDTSVEVMGLQSRMFKFIKQEADSASIRLGREYGTPKWDRTGFRNTHLTALAPTVSNSIISGGVSPSIEPIAANAFTQKTAKGVFLYRNPSLQAMLRERGRDDGTVWQSIVSNEGSVQHLDFLTAGEKEVYLTAREIPQYTLVTQAAARQPYIDQAQSLNIFVPADVDPKWFHRLHMYAWESGVKTLYYVRSGSVLKGDVASRYYKEDCDGCEG